MANQNDRMSANTMTPSGIAERMKKGERFDVLPEDWAAVGNDMRKVMSDFPIRFDDETREAQDDYYARKHERNQSDLDAATGMIRALILSLPFWAFVAALVWWLW